MTCWLFDSNKIKCDGHGRWINGVLSCNQGFLDNWYTNFTGILLTVPTWDRLSCLQGLQLNSRNYTFNCNSQLGNPPPSISWILQRRINDLRLFLNWFLYSDFCLASKAYKGRCSFPNYMHIFQLNAYLFNSLRNNQYKARIVHTRFT